MTQCQQVIGVDDQNRGVVRHQRGIAAELFVADPGGLVHAVQGHVEQRGADQSGSSGALLRRSPFRTGLERFPFIRLKQVMPALRAEVLVLSLCGVGRRCG